MNKQNKIRQVKLHSKYRPLRTSREDKIVPWLTVSGVWLENAGFKPGDRVEITIAPNELLIKNLSADGDHGH